MKKAREILEHFLSVGTWLDYNNTVDKIIIGDPVKEIRSVIVTWMSTFDALKEAANTGVDMVITHEPTFWEHSRELETMNTEIFNGIGEKKKEFIEKNGIVILRCHDTWDRMPDIGIPWAWGRFLGFTANPAVISENGFLHRYDITPVSLETFAESIAAKTAVIGEPVVQVCGNPEQMVSRIGIGTGCICNPADFAGLGCDAVIVCDDGTSYWREIQSAKDTEFPVIRVNHGTSEEPGMASLADYVRLIFPDINCRHLPHGCCYRQVGSPSNI